MTEQTIFKKINLTSWLILLTIALGLFLRFYKFESIPFGLNHDGALESLEAIELMKKPFPFKVHSLERPWLGETLFRYYLSGAIKILGPTPRAVKLASAFISILTVIFFYFFSKNLFDNKIAFFSTLFLSLSGWHIIMGKSVWRAISLPLFECLTFYLLFKALKGGKTIFYLLSGISLALTTYTYAASRFVPLIVFLVFVLLFLKRKTIFTVRKSSFTILVLSFFVFTLPLINFAVKYPSVFNSRSDFLFVGNRIKEVNSLQPLLDNFKKTVLMFTVRAEGDDFFVNEPLLDFPTNIFFIIGLLSSFYFIKNFSFQFTLIGFFLSLLPGLLSTPNGNRNIGVLPFVYLLSGIGLKTSYEVLKSSFKKRMFISNLFIIFVLLITLITVWKLYFGKNRREIFGFYPETTVVGNYMKDKLNDYDFYLTDNYPRDALTFLTYQGGDPFIRHYTWLEHKEDFLKVNQKNKGVIFVMFNSSDNQTFIPLLKQRFPNGEVSELKYIDDNINRSAAIIYTVHKI